MIETHNQLCQESLKLEKKWLTQIRWFRLTTTLIGVVVTNTFLLCNYHKVIMGVKLNHKRKKYHSAFCWYFSLSADPYGKQA
jgi:hypothetical protein